MAWPPLDREAINLGLGKTPKRGSPEYRPFMTELMRRWRKVFQPVVTCTCGHRHRCAVRGPKPPRGWYPELKEEGRHDEAG